MPVTFIVATHDPSPAVDTYQQPISDAEDLLARTWCKKSSMGVEELLQTSLFSGHGGVEKQDDWSAVRPQTNGFVNTVVDAYNGHHHLILRPDDMWMAILSQFNFYVNAHTEELRSHFVKHKGKKELIVLAQGTRYTVDFGNLAKQMTAEIDKNIFDKELKEWILPNFSTTSHNDTVICAVLMMSTLKAYLGYTMHLRCGIPSITLEGEKSDWDALVARLDKLSSFGDEPSIWASLLRPILSRFAGAFALAEQGLPQDIEFWSRVCHEHPQGSGPTYLSGWITAFCMWNCDGKLMGRKQVSLMSRSVIPQLVLDGMEYKIIESGDIPAGFCEVDVKLDDNGQIFESMMVSGHVASRVEGEKKDTLGPFPTWFIFVKQ